MDLIINESNINWNSTIYIVEGVFDMVSLYPLTNCIPLMGKVMSDTLYYTLLKKSKGYICIILDGDAQKDMYSMYKRLQTSYLKDKIRVVDLPDIADLSDIRKDFGKEGVIEVLKTNRKLIIKDFQKYNL
jgi:DNA primase